MFYSEPLPVSIWCIRPVTLSNLGSYQKTRNLLLSICSFNFLTLLCVKNSIKNNKLSFYKLSVKISPLFSEMHCKCTKVQLFFGKFFTQISNFDPEANSETPRKTTWPIPNIAGYILVFTSNDSVEWFLNGSTFLRDVVTFFAPFMILHVWW